MKIMGFNSKSIFLVFLSAMCLGSESIRPRGVRPDFASFYDPNSNFHCLDGSNEIPFNQVNDDYCDCQDGSDEPGTSACANGLFYCSNRGFKPSLVASSRVNDGICDCCDGSDEWAMSSPCQNNCDEMGKADREERERLEKVVQEGLKIKAEMSQQGILARKEKETEIETKRSELSNLEQEKETKRLIKEEREKVEKAALDVIREEEDKIRQEKEAKEKAEKEAEAKEYFAKLDKNGDGKISKEDLIMEITFDQNNDGMVSEEEANFYLSGHENYDEETFLNTGWLLMKHLFSKFEKVEKNNEDIEQDKDLDYDYDDEEHESDDEHSEDDIEAPTIEDPEPIPEKSGYSPEVQALVDSANVARDEFNAANNAFNDLNHDIDNLEKYLEKDFGPDDVFAALANQCFEFNDLEYTYKMCAFDYCAQKPLHGGGETRLGNWEKWATPHTSMSYERGVTCWNGPPRSTKVDLRCGAENKLVSASEPNRCEYLFLFETPAVCQPLPPPLQHDEL